jgi:hypothetical protein
MITDGSGSYANPAEVVIRPLPTVEHSGLGRATDGTCSVQVAMIREDVWQALVKVGKEYDGGYDGPFKIPEKEYHEEFMNVPDDPMELLAKGIGFDSPGPQDHVPFSVGVGSHFAIMQDKFTRGQATKEEADEFIQAAVELRVVEAVLGMTRYWWRPSYTAGPQFGEWRLHEQVNDAFAWIAKDVADKQEEEYGDY